MQLLGIGGEIQGLAQDAVPGLELEPAALEALEDEGSGVTRVKAMGRS